jgi:hypothetical protein
MPDAAPGFGRAGKMPGLAIAVQRPAAQPGQAQDRTDREVRQ